MLVHFVDHHSDLRMAAKDFGEAAVFLARIHGARWIRRRVEYEPARRRRDRALQHRRRDLEVCLGWAGHDDRLGACVEDAIGIGDPEWCGNDGFVTGFHSGDNGIENRLLAASRDHHLVSRVVDAVLALQLGGERCAQLQRAGNRGVLGLATLGGGGGSLDDMRGRGKVGLTDRQRNDVAALCLEFARTLRGDDAGGRLDALEALGDFEVHGCFSSQEPDAPSRSSGGAHITRSRKGK